MHYRDKKTGRFVSKKTWQRSRARGGKRFLRERIASKEAPRKRKPKLPKSRPRPRALPKETIIGELVPDGYILIHREESNHKSLELAVEKLFRLRRNNPEPEFFVRIAARKGNRYVFEIYAQEEIEFGGAFDSP